MSGITVSVDVVVLAPQDGRFATLLVRTDGRTMRERWHVPWGMLGANELIGNAAERVARSLLGTPAVRGPGGRGTPPMQVGAYGAPHRHPGGAGLSIGFLVAVSSAAVDQPVTGDDGAETMWAPADDPPALAPRQREILAAAVRAARTSLDQSPIAFRFLPQRFTLAQLQQIYELLLGRHVHKASFRRALRAARLVQPTGQWRVEGRGRPAQLFRYAPAKRRAAQRGIRFDWEDGA